mgnify:CR=1 FL=1|jgi:hypothetical protein
MSIETVKYVVFANAETKRRSGERRKILQQWLVQCPLCREAWFAPGASEKDLHDCEKCGCRFINDADSLKKIFFP